MSAILQLLATLRALQYSLTVGSTTKVIKATVYYDGYISGANNTPVVLGVAAIGTLAPTGIKGATVTSLYWSSSTNHSSGGTTYIEVTGSQSAGFINSVLLDGVSLGTVGAPTVSGSFTTFQLGTASINNPFGTSGSKKVTIT